MKILLVGLGSIGRRHLQNILDSGYTNVTIVSRSGVLPINLSHLPVYPSVDEALNASSYDAAFICTPTSLHTIALNAVVSARIPLVYLEKPVSHSLEGLAELTELADSYNSKIIVGYDLHFDAGIQKAKELIENGELGEVLAVNAQVGQYLPDWRPYEDYRKGMSARIETGGGVMLDLVHEFDYLLYLVGKVETVACHYRNTGALEIETEDVADVLLRFNNGAIGTIHLDYLQPKLIRNCVITCTNGSIKIDLAARELSWIMNDKTEEKFNYNHFERNDRFKEIINAFLNKLDDSRLTSFEDGIESLKLVIAAKHSAERELFIDMATFNQPVLTA